MNDSRDLFFQHFNVWNNLFKVFGLSALSSTRKSLSVKYELSIACITYSVVISILIVYVFYIQITDFYPKESSFVLTMLYCYLVTAGTLMAVLMIATGGFINVQFMNILNDPKYAPLFSLLSSHRQLALACVKQFCLSFTILTLCFIWDFLSSGQPLTFAAFLNIFMYFLFPIYNSLCISQFYITLFWLKRLLVHINESLAKVLQDRVEEVAMPNLKIVGNRFLKSFQESKPLPKPICDNIRKLRALCHDTYEISLAVNSIFSTRILLLIFHHCALGTLYVYWAFRHTFSHIHITLTALLNLYRAGVMSLVSIIWLIWPSTTTINEAKKTAILIQDISTSNDLLAVEVQELEIFSTQLLQERILFSPYGFFSLSTKTLLSMLATVASYLVILLQYDTVNNDTAEGPLNASNNTS